jgi:hypothetical protein
LSRTADDEPTSFGPDINPGFIYAGQFDTDDEVLPATKSVERGLPALRHREMKKLCAGELHCDVANVALNFVQIAKRAFHRVGVGQRR